VDGSAEDVLDGVEACFQGRLREGLGGGWGRLMAPGLVDWEGWGGWRASDLERHRCWGVRLAVAVAVCMRL